MNKQNANSTLYNSEVSRQISKKRKEIPKRIRQKFPQKKKEKKSHRARDSAAFYRTWQIFEGKK